MNQYSVGVSITESFLFGFRYFPRREELDESEFQIHLFCFCFFVVSH